MKRSLVVPVLCAILTFAAIVAAQQPSPAAAKSETPKIISGGVLNGKALSLPKPAYPPDAAAAFADGLVSVQVLIDESGSVLTAEATGGPENVSLRRAAEAAALQAKFAPTLLSGQPVKVRGVITYHFVLREEERLERIKYLGAGFFLTMVRESSQDLDALNPTQSEKAEFSEIIDGLSEGMNLPTIKGLDKIPADKRAAALDAAVSSLKAGNLSAAEKWQFEMGEKLGAFFGPMLRLAAKGDSADLSELDVKVFKERLASVLKLTEAAPSDFPLELLTKLKNFSELSKVESWYEPKTVELLEKRFSEFIAVLTGEDPTKAK